MSTTGVVALYIIYPGFTKHVVVSFFNLYLDHVFSVSKICVIILLVLFGFVYTFIAPLFYYSVEHIKRLLRLCIFVTNILSYLIATRSLRESRKFIETLKRSLGQSVILHLSVFLSTLILLFWITEIASLTYDPQEVFEHLALSGAFMSFLLSLVVLIVLVYELSRITEIPKRRFRRRLL